MMPSVPITTRDESIVLTLFVSAMLLSPALQFEALNSSIKIKP